MLQATAKSCLECRRLHYKCSGDKPRCRRCVNKDASCKYSASSQQGGGISKNVTKARKSSEETFKVRTSSERIMKARNVSNLASGSPDAKGSGSKVPFSVILNPSDSDVDASHIIPIKDRKIVIQEYYETFHAAHPFMPGYEDVFGYLDAMEDSADLVLGMSLIGSRTNMAAATVESTIRAVLSSMEATKADLIALQMLLMLFFVSHLSGLHGLTATIRQKLVQLCFSADLHCFDASSLPGSGMQETAAGIKEHLECPETRLSLIPPGFLDSHHELLADCVRRVFWEVLHIDTLLGIADGKTVSSLMDKPFLIRYPNSPQRNVFDYQSRAEASVLLNKVMGFNRLSQENAPSAVKFNEVKACLANWNLRLKSSGNRIHPPLINYNGNVNEGVHQSILMYTHAELLFHRPLSHLYDPTQAQPAPPCSLSSLRGDKNVHPDLYKSDDTITCSSQAIETRRCINAANDAILSIIDSEACDVLRRTPLICCTITFSALTHLSGYLWIEKTLCMDSVDELRTPLFSNDDLSLLKEYLKLALACLREMSSHWHLPGNMYTFLRHTVHKYAPSLYSSLDLDVIDDNVGDSPTTASTDIASHKADFNDALSAESFEMSDWTSLHEMESVLRMVQEADNGWH